MTRRRSLLPARQLPADVIEGYERRVRETSLPAAKLPEIIELRAIARELIGHLNAVEALPATT